ncbi:8571_t:CDS:2, partial [Cetraspora pellucida]
KTCISDILKQSDKWLNIDTTNKIEANRKRDRQPKWPMLDEAKTFAIALNISDFKGTSWINRFQEWLGLHQYYRNGEAASSPPIETLNKYRECLQEFCKGYTLENIWNADKTSLYWKM